MIDPTRWDLVLLIGQLAPQRVGVLSGRVGGREREGLEKLLRLAPVHCTLCTALNCCCALWVLCTSRHHPSLLEEAATHPQVAAESEKRTTGTSRSPQHCIVCVCVTLLCVSRHPPTPGPALLWVSRGTALWVSRPIVGEQIHCG